MAPAPRNSSRTASILQAATNLFALHGYHHTSTREIAHLAAVSENTMFRHFENKEEIFFSALRSELSGIELRHELLSGMTEGEPVEKVLPYIFELLADTVASRPQLLRLIAVAFLELQWKAEGILHEHLSPVLSAIHHYLCLNIERGKLRQIDPELLTAAMILSVILQPVLYKLVAGGLPPQLDHRDAASMHTRFWLDVLANRSQDFHLPVA